MVGRRGLGVFDLVYNGAAGLCYWILSNVRAYSIVLIAIEVVD